MTAAIGSLPPFEQISLLAQIGLFFANGGFTGTIDPNQPNTQTFITKALASIPIIIAKCTGEPQPTAAPTKAPVPAPALPPGLECFSGKSQVLVEMPEGSIVHKRMDALKIGDSVQTADGTFSKVYSFGHKVASSTTKYLQVFSAGMDNAHPLEISTEHLIYTHDASKNTPVLVAAGDLRVGDSLVTAHGSPSTILWIREVQSQGLFSPITATGNLIVNGVLASSYVSRGWLKDHVSGNTLHKFQHGAMLPLRLVCTMLVNCDAERYDETTGFSTWVHFWFTVEKWMLTLSPLPKTGFLLVLAFPAMLITLLGNLSDTPWHLSIVHVVAAAIGYIVWKRANRTSKDDKAGKVKVVKA